MRSSMSSSQHTTALEFSLVLSCCPVFLREVLEPLGGIEGDCLVIFCDDKRNAEYLQSQTYHALVEALWANCEYSLSVKKVSYRHRKGEIVLPIEPAQPDRSAYRRRTR